MRQLARIMLCGSIVLLLGCAGAVGQTPAQVAGLAVLREDLRGVAAAGGWPLVPPGPNLRLGDRGARVLALRARLALTDAADPRGGEAFDAGLEAAVERFQRRHGLATDGVVGSHTLAALGRTASERLRQIDVNLGRLARLPAPEHGLHILVNAAAFELTLLDDGKAVLRTPVIVGRPERATPEFASAVSALALNPDWTVPVRIARRDVLPRIRRDPDYLAREGFIVYENWSAGARALDPASIDWRRLPDGFPYKLRQLPGPTNALGRVKFLLDNPYDIYLHDTPAQELFRRPERALSNGCIRVFDPLKLADYLMQGAEIWTRREELLASGRTQTLALPRPVPVHIVYFTAWVDADGVVNWRDDIYGRDRAETETVAVADARVGCGIGAG